MAKEFIEKGIGQKHIQTAKLQQEELSYFTQSKTQKEATQEYVNAWAERNYRGNDRFLNWVKQLLRTENFMSFFKNYRYPVPSAKIINDRIVPQLERVYFAEDSYFKYNVSGTEIEEPEELENDYFKHKVFDALLFRHNDIVIHDLSDINTPYRKIIPIDIVHSIESTETTIERIAYRCNYMHTENLAEPEERKGFIYMDSEVYALYSDDCVLINETPHDLGKCPAVWVSKKPFSTENNIVRKSLFSFVKPDLEDFCMMRTFQKLTELNGAFPIITMIKPKAKTNQSEGKGKSSDKEPMTSREIGGQQSDEFAKTTSASNSPTQPGTVHLIRPTKTEGGGLDIDSVTNYINFHHFPTDILDFINKRVIEIRDEIEKSIVGDLQDQTGERKNEMQVRAGFVSVQDRLRGLSMQMSTLQKKSDWMMLALANGPDNVMVDVFYGTDFFTESQDELYALFEKSPNPIERKTILKRLARNRNRFNKDKAQRDNILYDLLPYSADSDFEAANNAGAIDYPTFQLQTRFSYWICLFEAQFGDIVEFWMMLDDASDSEKLIAINNLLIQIINQVAPQQQQQAAQGEEEPQNA